MTTERKICEHCGEPLPANYKFIYCAEGREEFADRQRTIDKDPLVTNVVYGSFTDPASGMNCVAVQFRRGTKHKELVKLSAAVKRFLKPMFDSKKPKDQYFNFDAEPTPYIGVNRLWEHPNITRLKWDGMRLRKMLRTVK